MVKVEAPRLRSLGFNPFRCSNSLLCVASKKKKERENRGGGGGTLV